jgi:hypothetical protein
MVESFQNVLRAHNSLSLAPSPPPLIPVCGVELTRKLQCEGYIKIKIVEEEERNVCVGGW